MAEAVTVQLIVDSKGAEEGTRRFEAAMGRAKKAANDAGTSTSSFEAAQRKWIQSLAATDPVLRAQVQMEQALQRQRETSRRALELGIGTQQAHAAQLERVREKYAGYVQQAQEAANANSTMGKATGLLTAQLGPLLGLLSAGTVIAFAKSSFDRAAAMGEEAEQAGVSAEAYQAWLAVMAQSGIAADQAAQIIGRLTRSIGDAQQQAGPARDAFNSLNIGLDQLRGGAESTLPLIAKSLLNIADPAQRAALEVDLFGKAGQRLESALKVLIDPTATLIEKQKALGQVMGHDVADAADAAADRLTAAWTRAKNNAAPNITWLVDKFSQFVELNNKAQDWLNHSAISAPLFSGAASKADYDAQHAPRMPAGIPSLEGNLLINGHAPTTTASVYSSANEDKFLANAKLQADLAGLSAARRAQEEATIARANSRLEDGNAVLRDQNGHLVKQVTSYQQARDILGEADTKLIEGYAATTAQGKAWEKVRETVQQYLTQLGQEADAAGKSALQRSIETDIIKAGEISQKARGVTENQINKTLAFNTKEIGKQNADAIALAETRKQMGPVEQGIADNLHLSTVALAAGRDERELALQIAGKELQLGAQLTDQKKQELKLTQQNNEAMHLKDMLEDLRTEVRLAGMSADERERATAAIQAGHLHASEAQQSEIAWLITQRQETERWRQVVEGIGTPLEEFPIEFLDDPVVGAEIETALQEIAA